MSETWLPVAGWEEMYEVSDHGRVRSLPRPYRRTERILTPTRSSGGRVVVTMCRDGKVHTLAVGRMVLEAFIGPSPSDKPYCLHWDDDEFNNRLENLRWGTASENSHDSVRNGSHYEASKVLCESGHPLDITREYADGRFRRSCSTCGK